MMSTPRSVARYGALAGLTPLLLGVGLVLLRVSAHAATQTAGPATALSSSSQLAQAVHAYPTIITMTSSANPSRFGQPVAFTATLHSSGGTPTGTVQFSVDGRDVGRPVPLTGGAAVSDAIPDLAVRVHAVVATYRGVERFAGSAAGLLGGQSVTKAPTTTSISSSANPSDFGQPVTFTATVASIVPGGGTPAGVVAFYLDGQPLQLVALSSGSGTTAPVSRLRVGSHTVQAVYLGTASYIVSAALVPGGQTVKAPSTTTVSASANPSVFGQPVSFTATVSAGPGVVTPTGSVSFFLDGALFETHALANGVATSSSISGLAVRSHTVTATYAGDSDFGRGGSMPLVQAVDAAGTATTVSSANPTTVYGQPVAFTATVAAVAPGAGIPTGRIVFSADGSDLVSATLSGGSAVSPPISSLDAGAHAVAATYVPSGLPASSSCSSPGPACGNNPSFKASSGSTSQNVNQAGVNISITSDPNPATTGQTVAFVATVTPAAPGAGTPTGMVEFRAWDEVTNQAFDLGGGVVAADGTASTSATLDSAYLHVWADYSGDGNFAAASSPELIQPVFALDTTTTISSSRNPSTEVEGVTFGATVSMAAPGGGPVANLCCLQFVAGDSSTLVETPIGGPQDLDGTGTASVSTSSLPPGEYQIVAVFTPPPFSQLATSQGNLFYQEVTAASPSPAVPGLHSSGGLKGG